MNLKTDQSAYRVWVEESFSHESEQGKTDNIWRYFELRGRRGIVYSYSSTHLAVMIVGTKTAALIMRAGQWKRIQNGSDAQVFLLPDKDWREAARAVCAHRKKQYSAETLKAASDRLARWHKMKREKAANGQPFFSQVDPIPQI